MKLAREIRRKVRGLKFPLLLLGLFVYAQYHMFSGDRGIMVWHTLKEQVAELKIENDKLANQQKKLQIEVARLKGANPDVDYLDQLIRQNMGYMRRDERVIYLPATQISH